MFALFFNNGSWPLDSIVNKGLKEYTPSIEFNTQSQHFDHVKKNDTRLRQILVNHYIATSPELAGKAPKPNERNLKRKANE